MYVDYFQLTERPFLPVATQENTVEYQSFSESLERCCQGIKESSGPVVISGSPGCGKTTLLTRIESRFARKLTAVSLNCTSIYNREELIQCIMYEMGLPFQASTVGELRLQLIDHLKSIDKCPNGLLLLIDEAHQLSDEVLEEVRMITNLVCGGRNQVRLVLAGGQTLEEKLAHPRHDSFNQRISVRCYMQRMTSDETMFFVLEQVSKGGRDGRDLFQPAAIQKIYEITDGIPRLVTQLCSAALRLACTRELSHVTQEVAQAAWCELQQLPLPNHDSELAASDENIVEFGSLNDEIDEISTNHLPTEENTGWAGDSELLSQDMATSSELIIEETIIEERVTEWHVPQESDEIENVEVENHDEEQLASLLSQLGEIGVDEVDSTEPSDVHERDASRSQRNETVTPDADELFGSSYSHEERIADSKPQSLAYQDHISYTITSASELDLDNSSIQVTPLAEIPEIVTESDDESNRSEGAAAEIGQAERTASEEVTPVEQDATVESPSIAETDPPASGHVMRMDYDDLFQQLKTILTQQAVRNLQSTKCKFRNGNEFDGSIHSAAKPRIDSRARRMARAYSIGSHRTPYGHGGARNRTGRR